MQTKALFCHAPHDLRVEHMPIDTLGDHDIQVKIAFGGICGSDLHYYNHGGFGAIKILHPMILGHEISGVIEKRGKSVKNIEIGDKIALNPSNPCGNCSYCLDATPQHCTDMRFYGSAMRNPHIHGAFRERIVAKASQAEVVNCDLKEAALAEPLAVCLHAVNQAGSLLGKNILILGCGPIGALTLLAAKFAGAQTITVIDIAQNALNTAKLCCATAVYNSKTDDLSALKANKGTFDICFEASGNNQAFLSALDMLKPRGTLVQLGLGGEFTLPVNQLVAKEINWKGTFRFNNEFALAAKLISSGKIDVKPLITGVYSLENAKAAFAAASDKSTAMKCLISF